MIYVQGNNPTTILRRDHAHLLLPLVHALVATLFLGRLQQDDHHHRLIQSKTGANSYGLYLADGQEYHFRGASAVAHLDMILVYDRWNYQRDNAPPLASLSSVEACIRWASSLRYNPTWAHERYVLGLKAAGSAS